MTFINQFKTLDAVVFPSTRNTISVQDDPIYGGAHFYAIANVAGFENGEARDGIGQQLIQFVEKRDDGTVIHGVQSEQLALVLLDRCRKLNARFPSEFNKMQIEGLLMFLDGCERRVRSRMARGVMGELKK